jgi:hypothetical protein
MYHNLGTKHEVSKQFSASPSLCPRLPKKKKWRAARLDVVTCKVPTVPRQVSFTTGQYHRPYHTPEVIIIIHTMEIPTIIIVGPFVRL